MTEEKLDGKEESLGLSLEQLPKLVSQLKVMNLQQKQRQWAETLKGIRSGCVKKEKKKDSIHMLISFPELQSKWGFKLMSVCACSVMSNLLRFFEITRLLCP